MARTMSPELITLVSERFKALSDPARLRLLSALRPGDRSVGELVEQTGLSQANASKHQALLHASENEAARVRPSVDHRRMWRATRVRPNDRRARDRQVD